MDLGKKLLIQCDIYIKLWNKNGIILEQLRYIKIDS